MFHGKVVKEDKNIVKTNKINYQALIRISEVSLEIHL